MAVTNFYRSDGWVKNVQGAAIPGAQIYVLTQPANVVPPITPPRTTPVPFVPNPQALIYSDQGLTPITQPILTDGFGHYDFYVLPGLYTVAVFFNGQLQQFYIDQTIGNVGSEGGAGLEVQTNGTPNFDQSLLNLEQGTGITIFTDNEGNTTINATGSSTPLLLQTNGVDNPDQTLQNLVNGVGIEIVTDGSGNTTITSTSTPSPSIARFAQWEGGPAQHIGDWQSVFDTISTGDSGATGAFLNPDATHGARNGFDTVSFQQRNYVGSQFAWTGRNTTFKTRLGFAFEDSGTCQSEEYFGISNGQGFNAPAFTFVGFHILDNYNGPSVENYHAKVIVNNVSIFDVDTGVVVGIQSYPSDPQAHNFSFTMSNGGASMEFFIDGNSVAIYNAAAVLFAAGLAFQQNSLNGTTGHMMGQVEYMYLDNATL